jgi:hypothetical protein
MEKLNAGRKKAHETMRKRKEAKLQAMAKAAEKKPVATKESAPPVAKLAPAVSVESRVSGLLSTLTLLEAKQLYIELFKVFGEVK